MGRRIKQIELSDILLTAKLSDSTNKDLGIPKTAKLITVIFNPRFLTTTIYFEDDSFDEIAEGSIPPLLNR